MSSPLSSQKSFETGIKRRLLSRLVVLISYFSFLDIPKSLNPGTTCSKKLSDTSQEDKMQPRSTLEEQTDQSDVFLPPRCVSSSVEGHSTYTRVIDQESSFPTSQDEKKSNCKNGFTSHSRLDARKVEETFFEEVEHVFLHFFDQIDYLKPAEIGKLQQEQTSIAKMKSLIKKRFESVLNKLPEGDEIVKALKIIHDLLIPVAQEDSAGCQTSSVNVFEKCCQTENSCDMVDKATQKIDEEAKIEEEKLKQTVSELKYALDEWKEKFRELTEKNEYLITKVKELDEALKSTGKELTETSIELGRLLVEHTKIIRENKMRLQQQGNQITNKPNSLNSFQSTSPYVSTMTSDAKGATKPEEQAKNGNAEQCEANGSSFLAGLNFQVEGPKSRSLVPSLFTGKERVYQQNERAAEADWPAQVDGLYIDTSLTCGTNKATVSDGSSSNPTRKHRVDLGSNGQKLSKFANRDLGTNRGSNPHDIRDDTDYLCDDYKKRCHVRFDCCNKYWSCHRCYNNEGNCEEKKLRSRETKFMKCVMCKTEQLDDFTGCQILSRPHKVHKKCSMQRSRRRIRRPNVRRERKRFGEVLCAKCTTLLYEAVHELYTTGATTVGLVEDIPGTTLCNSPTSMADVYMIHNIPIREVREHPAPVQETQPGSRVSLSNPPYTPVERRIYLNYTLLIATLSWLLAADTRVFVMWAREQFQINVGLDARSVFIELDRRGILNSSQLNPLRQFFEDILRFELVHIIDEFELGNYAILQNVNLNGLLFNNVNQPQAFQVILQLTDIPRDLDQ